MKKRLIVFVIGAVVAGAVWAYLRFQGHTNANPNIIRVSGNIEVTHADASFKIAGRVAQRFVNEGDSVKAGQVVAHIENAELVQEVALRKTEIWAAQAVLSELEAGSRPEEISQGEAALELAKAEEKQLAAEYERHRTLFGQSAVSASALDTAEKAYRVAQAKTRTAQENLALLNKGPRQEKIDEARAKLEQTKQALALAETRLGYATLASPLTGVVLSKNIESGEYVVPGTPVVTVGDLVSVWLRAYINETDLGRVKVGQTARVTADTYAGKVYEGRVSFISSEAEFTPRNVQTKKERVKLVYRVKIDIANPQMELKPGMPADAEIMTGQTQ